MIFNLALGGLLYCLITRLRRSRTFTLAVECYAIAAQCSTPENGEATFLNDCRGGVFR